jgi:hypothetical protein
MPRIQDARASRPAPRSTAHHRAGARPAVEFVGEFLRSEAMLLAAEAATSCCT